jgi:hypothetical protein
LERKYDAPMQKGTIYREGRNWVLRYWEYQIRNGLRTRVNVHKKLAPIGPAYQDKKSVEPLAWKILEPINTPPNPRVCHADYRVH